jgi:hypothetical protein
MQARSSIAKRERTVLVNDGKGEMTEMKTFLMWLISGVLVVSLSLTAHSGALADFERGTDSDNPAPPPGKKLDKPRDNDRRRSPGRHDEHMEDFGFGAWMTESLAEGTIMALAYGGLNSLALVYQPSDSEFQQRESGEAVIPFLAFDTSYQKIGSDISAMDYRGEVGVAFVGFQARTTLYDEKMPGDDLTISQMHGLYRMSFGKQVEVDLGFGSLTIKGDKKETGFSITTPVLFHPNDVLGIEWRPVWSTIKENRISDNELSVMTGWRYFSLRFGYRWVTSDTVSLNGPQAGLSLRW